MGDGLEGTNWRQAAFYFLIAFASAVLCWIVAGTERLIETATSASLQTLDLIPRIALGLIIAGLVSVLLPAAIISSWLGHASGVRGIAIATALGSVMPGGPMTAFPLIMALAAAGADIGALIAFLTAWGVISLQRMLVWELPLLGADFALIRFLICTPLPVIAGLLARSLAKRLTVFRIDRLPRD